MNIDFDPLFYPKSVAIFGAKENRAGFILPFKELNYKGKVFLIVDPSDEGKEEIYGYKCYKSIFDFPDSIDHAIIAVRREFVPQAIKDCKKKGVKFAHIFTAGFSEKDNEGKKIEDKLKKIINEPPFITRIIGPNCMGVYCPEGRIGFGPTFSDKPGDVAVLSQSGALAYKFVFDGMQRGFHFSKMLSLGNSIDLTILDLLENLENDKKTKVICIYVEEVKNGKGFIKKLKQVTKPVIILKGGVTDVGKQAAMSHTSAIASDIRVWNSIFRQTSAISVDSLREMADLALAFSKSKFLPSTKKIAIMSFSGGIGVVQSDLCRKLGLELPPFTEKLKIEMKKYFPAWIEPSNPLDLPTIFWKPRFLEIYRELAKSDIIDSVIIQAPARLADPYWTKIQQRDLKSILNNMIEGGKILNEHNKLYFVAIPPSYFHDEWKMLKNWFTSHGFPVFFSISDAARAILKMNQYKIKRDFK
ncbi:MAG: CoA-binding protein [Candidatus Helarchaeota archaeon]